PRLGFFGAWFLITLAPTSSIVPIATEVGAERRMYLPLMSLIAVVVTAAFRIIADVPTRRLATPPGTPSATGALISLVVTSMAPGATTVARIREYVSSLSLARTVVERYPTSVAHHMVGAELSKLGRHEEAVAELRQALPGAPRAHYSLGVDLFNQG